MVREGKGVGVVLSQAKGEERRREVRAVLERVERSERGGTAFTMLYGGETSVMPVPAWSTRALRPGEWREEASSDTLYEPMVVERVHIGLRRTRVERMVELASSGDTLNPAAVGGLYNVTRHSKRRRVEEGSDVSGVT